MTTRQLVLLPAYVDRGPGESTESHLERLAEANLITPPDLLRTLNIHSTQAPDSTRPPPGPGIHPSAWGPGRTTQACGTCLQQTGYWHEIWRHPKATVCLTHGTWLTARCPSCHKPFRSHRHHQLRSVDAPTGTCGNPTGHRGEPCDHDLATLGADPAPPPIRAAQSRIQAAIGGQPVRALGTTLDPDTYLHELEVLTVLVLHLAVQPGSEQLAPWAPTAQADHQRSPGHRNARWMLAPPAAAELRGLALAQADVILTAASIEDAADLLHPWTELTPHTPDGQLGWLADHTRMTSTLSRLVMNATATRRRLSTLLDIHPDTDASSAATLRLSSIPQVLPDDLYRRHVARLIAVGPVTGRLYTSLCLARRHSDATTWAEAAEALGLPGQMGTRNARACSGELTCPAATLIQALDDVATELDTGLDYWARENDVRRLVGANGWYPEWAAEHLPGSPATSARYALTWLWTHYARGHLDTSPGWRDSTPDHLLRARYRRYATRLTTPATDALIALVTSPPMRGTSTVPGSRHPGDSTRVR